MTLIPHGKTLNAVASLSVHWAPWTATDRPIDFQRPRKALRGSFRETPTTSVLLPLQSSLTTPGCHPGTCRHQTTFAENRQYVSRWVTANKILTMAFWALAYRFSDPVRDFTRRKDGLIAYNLATAIDDGSGITHVLRGQDLLLVTAPQRYLMTLLNLQPPEYAHIPCLEFEDGSKLSKQTHAPALNDETAVNLIAVVPRIKNSETRIPCR